MRNSHARAVLCVTARLRRELPIFTFYQQREGISMKTNISVSFKFKYLSQELNSREVRLHWTKRESGDNRAEVSEEDTFK